MKRIVVGVFFLGSFLFAHAQDVTAPVLTTQSLTKKMEKSNEDITDEKASLKAKTWFNRGEVFQDIADVNIQFIRIGMPVSELKLLKKEPNEIKTKEEDGKVVQVLIYDRIEFYVEFDAVVSWKETKKIHPDPLPISIEAYKKALELDVKGSLNKKVLENMERMKKQLENQAILAFTSRDYAGALAAFENILDCSSTEVYDNPDMDTVVIYNSALAAKNAGDHEKAIKYFRKSAEIGYGGSDVFYLLKNEYIALKDSGMALKVLEEGFEMYPDTFLILIEIVNYHLTAGNSEEGLKYLEMAKEQEVDNPSIYFAQGTLYEKIGKPELALEAYKGALGVDPEYFNAHFNIGALYFNKAVAMYEDANAKEDPAEYKAAKELADEELKNALQPMEKASDLAESDGDKKACLETLKTIYYRLQMEDKYQEIQEIIESMQ